MGKPPAPMLVDEVKNLLGFATRHSVYELIRNGHLHPTKVGRDYHFNRAEVARVLAARAKESGLKAERLRRAAVLAKRGVK